MFLLCHDCTESVCLCSSLDTTLIDFTDMKCQRGDLSFIFCGDAAPSESFVVLDNEQKVYQRIHHEARSLQLLSVRISRMFLCNVCDVSGVRDGDGGGGGHPHEQRHLLRHPLHQIHHLLTGADGLALQRGQNGQCVCCKIRVIRVN